MGRGSFLAPSWDFFAYDPSYELATFKTWVGVVLSNLTLFALLLYIGLTARDFVTRPPELVTKQTLELPNFADKLLFDIPDIALNMAY